MWITNAFVKCILEICQQCENYTDFSKVKIPYAFKLLMQELITMNIAPRIIT